MLNRLTLAVAVSVLLSAHQVVGASPITYDFTGTLNVGYGWVAGNFSGSFTINADPVVVNGSGAVPEYGGDVSITLDGSAFRNTPQDLTSTALYASETPDPSGPPLVRVDISGWAGSIGPSGADFHMTFTDLGGAEQLANLRNFNFSTATAGLVTLNGDTSPEWQMSGTITSIEPISAPEPSTWVVFAGLGIAALVHRHRRQS